MKHGFRSAFSAFLCAALLAQLVSCSVRTDTQTTAETGEDSPGTGIETEKETDKVTETVTETFPPDITEKTDHATQTWVAVDIDFETDKTYGEGEQLYVFTDVTFTHRESGKKLTVPAFWYGGKTFTVRFAPTEYGVWDFVTSCGSDASLDGKTGTVAANAYKGPLEIYRRGFVKTNGSKHFVYDDGTPFFYLGDTHWQLGDESYEMVQTICEKRVSQGFTVWQSQPGSYKANIIDGVDDADMEGFHHIDRHFRIIADAGLTHANTEYFWPLSGMSPLIRAHGGWTEPKLTGMLGTKKVTMPDLSDEAKAYLEKLARYWVARYSAYPTIWTLGQECDNDPYQDENSEWNAVNNPYKYLAEYLGKYDPYDHPVTAHQESTGDTVAYGNGLGTGEVHMIWYPGAQPSAFRHVDAHTMYAAQWHPHLTKRDDYMSARDYWYNGQGKPVVNFEGLYVNLWTKNYGARAQAWASFLTGLYGCAWGGQPTWAYQNGFQKDIPSDDGVDLILPEEKQAPTWQDALEYPSSYQMGYMRDFLEQTEWYNLIPRFNNWAYFVPSSNVYAYCASNKKNTEMVIYFYSYTDPSVAERINTKKDGGILTGTVGSLIPFAKYSYQWFDPISGEYLQTGTFRASGAGTWYAGIRPDDTDLVLLIQKSE